MRKGQLFTLQKTVNKQQKRKIRKIRATKRSEIVIKLPFYIMTGTKSKGKATISETDENRFRKNKKKPLEKRKEMLMLIKWGK